MRVENTIPQPKTKQSIPSAPASHDDPDDGGPPSDEEPSDGESVKDALDGPSSTTRERGRPTARRYDFVGEPKIAKQQVPIHSTSCLPFI